MKISRTTIKHRNVLGMKRVHDLVTGLVVLFWVNWVTYHLVTSIFFDGRQPNPALSKPESGIYTVSKSGKSYPTSATTYYRHRAYWFLAWSLWWSSWPLLLLSHLIGRKIDESEPSLNQEQFLNQFEDAEKILGLD